MSNGLPVRGEAAAPETAIAAAKAEMRARMKSVRAAIPETTRIAAAQRIAASLTALFDRPPAVVSSYLAIGDELDPAPIETAVRARGHTIALPVMTGRDQPLTFRAWRQGELLATRAWGIREPGPAAPVVAPDILLVPLLAFDRQGYRLGYGGGYYDRSLALLRNSKPVVAIGVAFMEQRVDCVPHLDYDQRLDLILTPAGLCPAS